MGSIAVADTLDAVAGATIMRTLWAYLLCWWRGDLSSEWWRDRGRWEMSRGVEQSSIDWTIMKRREP